MKRLRNPLALTALGLAALLWPSCAPVDPNTPPETPSAESLAKERENVTLPPRVVPAGGLQKRVELAIQQVRDRELQTTNGFWTVFHGILGLGPSITLSDPLTGVKYNAVDYVRSGRPVRGMRFIPMGEDGLDVETARELFVSQGHRDQFAAEMMEWGLPATTEFTVEGRKYPFLAFAKWSKASAHVKPRPEEHLELSWTIVLLADCYGTNLKWKNQDGDELTFEDLVRYELDQSIEAAACGGTHRLFGLQWIYYLRQREGLPLTGVWAEIPAKMQKYAKLARQYQNPDGSFSTDFFVGPGNVRDMQRRMNTTGHILEWLALTLSDKELKEPWVENAVNALTMMFMEIQGQPMEGGTMYHAVHGLVMYHARMWGTEWLGPNTPLIPLPDSKAARSR